MNVSLKRRGATLVVGLSLVGLSVATSGTASAATAKVPAGLSVNSFNTSFAVMAKLKGLTAAGKGLVGVVLPDTTSSTRYVDFDAPLLTKAFQKAGYKSSQYKIDNAQGVDATQLADVQADISLGATVIVFDPLDPTVGAQAEAYAQSHGVAFISYDRATFVGKKTYYVSFNNFKVGQLIGQGLEACVTAWGVKSPKVFELDGGEDTDPNAISFAQGYNSVIWNSNQTPLSTGKTNKKGYTLVGDQITPSWTNSLGATIFQQQFTAHPEINATVEANDGLANVVISDLKNAGVGPKKIPTTGQDAQLTGMTNILTGYQCGTVYKPVYLEAQDAVVLATILRAHQTPPKALVNATTTPPKGATGKTQPASLLAPKWVTTANMNSTVIKDGWVSPSALCAAAGASACAAAGITP
jgi:D-xylose transport system substrate-binding protein